jgi:MerC mercury resistance protein
MNSAYSDTPATWLDLAGICLSLLCAAHCLLMPVLITTLPLIGLGALVTERTEGVLVLIALIVAAGSLSLGIPFPPPSAGAAYAQGRDCYDAARTFCCSRWII